MRYFIKLAVLSLAVPFLAASALADDRPSGTAQSGVEDCDWFRNAVIGTRCAHSYALGSTVLFDRSSYSRSTPFEITETESRALRLSGGMSVTSTNWLTLSYSSAYTFAEQDSSSVVSRFPMKGRFVGRGWRTVWLSLLNTNDRLRHSFVDIQTIAANLNLLDTGPSARNRFVVNAIIGDSILPAHDGITTENNLFGGIAAHSQWYLGPPGTSLIGSVDLKLDHRTGPEDNLHAYATTSLLISNDRLGLAFGPFHQGAFWLSSSGPRSAQTDVEWVGGKVVWQPFRNTKALLLDGLVLNASAMRTVGPANWVPADEADTRSLVLTGSATWHFRF